MIHAQEARQRSGCYIDVYVALGHADAGIRPASSDGCYIKQMFGAPWDAPDSTVLALCKEALEKRWYVVKVEHDHTIISWEK